MFQRTGRHIERCPMKVKEYISIFIFRFDILFFSERFLYANRKENDELFVGFVLINQYIFYTEGFFLIGIPSFMRMPAAHIKNGKIRYSPQYRTICQLICLFDNVYFRFLDCGFQFVANRVRHIRHCKKRLTLQCRLKTGFRRHLRSVRKVAPAARTSRRSLCITAHLFFQIFQVQRKIRQSVSLFLFADNPPAIQNTTSVAHDRSAYPPLRHPPSMLPSKIVQ